MASSPRITGDLARGHVQSIEQVRDGDPQDQSRAWPLVIVIHDIGPKSICDWVSTIAQSSHGFGQCQRRSLGVGEKRCLAPSADREKSLVRIARRLGVTCTTIHARRTAIDLLTRRCANCSVVAGTPAFCVAYIRLCIACMAPGMAEAGFFMRACMRNLLPFLRVRGCIFRGYFMPRRQSGP